jgi:DNA-binding CsgD family transcriptional regulator
MQITLEEFSSVVAAIHAAAETPERWPEAYSAVKRLMNSSAAQPDDSRAWEKLLAFDALDDDPRIVEACEPSVQRLMALLAPHFRRARQVEMRLAQALPGRLALASLDRLAIAAFIVNRAGALQHLNASARTLLANDRCVRIKHGRFRFYEPALNSAFEAALRSATQEPARSSLLPLSCCKEEVYEVSVLPLEENDAGARAQSLALVVIARPLPDATSIERRARGLYGLTEAEARVMAALTLGGTVEEIAVAHRVRTSTVRAQVRSIFEKTGVHRQTDLVRLALSGAPLLTGPDR